MSRSTSILLVLLGVLIGSAWNDAEPTTDHPLRIPASLERVAIEYWSARGVEPPADPEVFEATDDLALRGWARTGGKRIWLAEEAVLDLRGPAFRRAKACALYLHERGHTAGLTHDSHWPIMDPSLPLIPRPCRRWARSGSGHATSSAASRRSPGSRHSDMSAGSQLAVTGAAYAEAARRATNVAERDHLVRQAARVRGRP